MKPKNITPIILSFCLSIFAFFPLNAQVEFSIESASVDQGQHFGLNTTVKNFDKIVSIQFTINWDPAILSLDSIGGYNIPGLSSSSFGTSKVDKGIVSLSWIDFSALGKSLADGTSAFKLYFQAVGASGTNSDVDITSNPIQIEITDVNSNGDNIGANINKGNVEITTNKATIYFDTTTINLPGRTCNYLKTKGFEEIQSLSGTVTWDPSKISFDSICCLHPFLNESQLNSTFSNSGNILLNIDDPIPGLNPYDKLFGICFTAVGSAFDEVSVDLNSNLFPYSISAKPTGPVKFKKGLVKLTLDKVRMGGENFIAEKGDLIEVPVVNLTTIPLQIIQGGFQFETQKLQFKGIRKGKLAQFNSDSLNVQQIGAGRIGFHYAKATGPENITKNDTLFYLEFKVLIDSGTTSLVQYDGYNNPIVVLNYTQLILLPLVLDTSHIVILPYGARLYTQTISGLAGDTVCLSIQGNGIKNVTEINGSLNYDDNLLYFISIKPVNLPADPLINYNLSNGKIVFNWKDYAGSPGISFQDGAELFQVCFKLIGTPGSEALISFDSLGSYINRSDIPGHSFSLKMNSTLIKILGSAVLGINSSQKNNACTGYNQGAITLELTGGKEPFKFNWSDGVNTQNRINLTDGIYKVTVQDNSNPKQEQVLVFEIIHYADKPFLTPVEDQKLSCPKDSVELQVNKNNYQLSWLGNTSGLYQTGYNKFRIDKPGQFIYQFYDANTSCFTNDTFLVLPAPTLENANAGLDQKACEESFVKAIQSDTIHGYWSTTGNALIMDPTDKLSSILELESGPNTFIWSISSSTCPNYDSDTVVISVPFPAIAIDDQIDIRSSKTFNILENDLTANGSYFIKIADSLITGISIDNTGLLKYKAGEELLPLTIQYALCNTECPTLCSFANISLYADSSIVKPENSMVPNVISPNNDGINDELVFTQLKTGQYNNAKILIFNKQGRVLYKDLHYKNDWNGIDNDHNDLPIDTYYYVLWLNLSSGKPLKGPVTILR